MLYFICASSTGYSPSRMCSSSMYSIPTSCEPRLTWRRPYIPLSSTWTAEREARIFFPGCCDFGMIYICTASHSPPPTVFYDENSLYVTVGELKSPPCQCPVGLGLGLGLESDVYLDRVGQRDGDSERQALWDGNHQHGHSDDEEFDKVLNVDGSALCQPCLTCNTDTHQHRRCLD